MKKDSIYYLYQVYLDDTATQQELHQLEAIMADPQYQHILDEAFYNSYFSAPKARLTTADLEKKEQSFQHILSETAIKPAITPLWPKILFAAAVSAIIFGIAIFYYKNDHSLQKNHSIAYQNDVAPGTTGATLTLADGSKINLDHSSKGTIASQSGINISKTANGQLNYELKKQSSAPNQINTLSTARGQTYTINLPDGSKIILNAASSLTYSASLMERGLRRVKLEGEAYFQISKDKKHPFLVESKGQTVEVLGTEFNVNAYKEEMTVKTTLLEGSVKVTPVSAASPSSQSILLKPNQQAILSASNAIAVHQADIEEVIAWKNGEFLFKEDDFKTVMRKIARWYDVEVIYETSTPENFQLGGFSSRSRNISVILKMIEKTGAARFRIDGKKVYVSR